MKVRTMRTSVDKGEKKCLKLIRKYQQAAKTTATSGISRLLTSMLASTRPPLGGAATVGLDWPVTVVTDEALPAELSLVGSVEVVADVSTGLVWSRASPARLPSRCLRLLAAVEVTVVVVVVLVSPL